MSLQLGDQQLSNEASSLNVLNYAVTILDFEHTVLGRAAAAKSSSATPVDRALGRAPKRSCPHMGRPDAL
jgi:hypothetical protein